MSVSGSASQEEFFRSLNADDNEVTEMESLCVHCMEQGTTKLMLIKIPMFREVVVSSFDCPHCHYQNSELSSAIEVSQQGIELELKVKDKRDLNRIVVKTDHASVRVPELDLEIPENTQKGDVTTVEGVLNRVITGLNQDQARRKDEHPEDYEAIVIYIKRIEDCLELNPIFSLIIRDISGNSFIGQQTEVDLLSSTKDTNLITRKFDRISSDNDKLGIGRLQAVGEEEEEDRPSEPTTDTLKDEVLEIPTSCSECGMLCTTKMKVTEIPFFKEVIIMATDCEGCGHRTNEVKSGGGIEPKGKKVTLKVKNKIDLSRDVLKSDTCYVEIPELELVGGCGTIVGKFTTVEGLILDIRKHLAEENPLFTGDSVAPEVKEKLNKFCVALDDLLFGEREFTLILDDPAGNCYVQNICAPEEDPQLTVEDYERSQEQNDELGLSDMNVGESAES